MQINAYPDAHRYRLGTNYEAATEKKSSAPDKTVAREAHGWPG